MYGEHVAALSAIIARDVTASCQPNNLRCEHACIYLRILNTRLIRVRPPFTSAARLSALPLVAQRTGEKRMCSPVLLPADAASLREKLALSIGINRVGPWLAAIQSVVSMLSLMAPRVCTLVLSSLLLATDLYILCTS